MPFRGDALPPPDKNGGVLADAGGDPGSNMPAIGIAIRPRRRECSRGRFANQSGYADEGRRDTAQEKPYGFIGRRTREKT